MSLGLIYSNVSALGLHQETSIPYFLYFFIKSPNLDITCHFNTGIKFTGNILKAMRLLHVEAMHCIHVIAPANEEMHYGCRKGYDLPSSQLSHPVFAVPRPFKKVTEEIKNSSPISMRFCQNSTMSLLVCR